jgi:hypothetical protein
MLRKQRFRPAVTTFPVASGTPAISVSVVRDDGTLQLLRNIDGQWGWWGGRTQPRDRNTNTPIGITSNPSALYYSGNQTVWSFAIGADHNLWAYGHDWVSLGNPGVAHVSLASDPSAINYTGGTENVFVIGDDGNLYADHFDGNRWIWNSQLLHPPGIDRINSDPAVANYTGDTENVFIIGNDGNLYADHFSPGIGWGWVNLGNPGVALASDPSAINYAADTENVFAIGSDGNLHARHYDPRSGWVWANLGNPGVGFVSDPAADNFVDGAENVFVMGDDGNLWAAHYGPADGWSWKNLYNPGVKVTFVSDPAAITVANIEDVLLLDSNGNVWAAHYSGCWSWVNHGQS